LKEKDPEFYKYLEENDRALLDFGGDGDGGDTVSVEGEADDEEEEEDDTQAVPSQYKGKAREEPEKLGEGQIALTKDMLREWQHSIIEACFYGLVFVTT
jgi:nucleolar complex protein 2